MSHDHKNHRQKASEIYRAIKTKAHGQTDRSLREQAMAVNPQLTDESFMILKRIARDYSETEFVEALTKGVLPPIKLTNKEMEVIRGGFFSPVFDYGKHED